MHPEKSVPCQGRLIDLPTSIIPGRPISFTKNFPCHICGGHRDMPRGHGIRCFGFLAPDGWIHCSRKPSSLADRGGMTWAYPPGRNWAPGPQPVLRAGGDKAEGRRRVTLVTTWAATVPSSAVEAAPMRIYFASRGLAGPLPATLRFHPDLEYWEDGRVFATFPAMVALVEGPAGCITLHRTYLTNNGQKALIASPRKLMPPAIAGTIRGAAIRLGGNPVDRLAVAEGIETALAFAATTNYTTWATISAGGMASLIVPAGVKEIVIAADHDASGTGERAARVLARRLLNEGHHVWIAMPPNVNTDWADVLLAEVGGS